MNSQPKKVLAFGTFDIIHPGHLAYLKKARSYGDELIVVVGRDEVVRRRYGKKPLHSEKQRLELAGSLRLVDRATLGFPVKKRADYLRIIQKEKPQVICLGYDEKINERWLKNELIRRGGPEPVIVRLAAFCPEKLHTQTIKNNRPALLRVFS